MSSFCLMEVITSPSSLTQASAALEEKKKKETNISHISADDFHFFLRGCG